MKKRDVIGFLFLVLISLNFVWAGSCGEINDNQLIMRLSGNTNAHGEWVGSGGNYQTEICYNNPDFGWGNFDVTVLDGGDVRTCRVRDDSTTNQIVRLSSATNAHGERFDIANPLYPPVCYGDLVCEIAGPGEDCNYAEDYKLILSLSSATNAHLEKGQTNYQYKVCCKNGQQIGDENGHCSADGESWIDDQNPEISWATSGESWSGWACNNPPFPCCPVGEECTTTGCELIVETHETCWDYETEAECNADADNAAQNHFSVDNDNLCGQGVVDYGDLTCEDTNCVCEWGDIYGDGNDECGFVYESSCSNVAGPIDCPYKCSSSISNTGECIGGQMEVVINSVITNPDTGNIVPLPQECSVIPSLANCVGGTETYVCGFGVELSFFGMWNLGLGFLIIIGIYFVRLRVD